jgi:hypothetical protein
MKLQSNVTAGAREMPGLLPWRRALASVED